MDKITMKNRLEFVERCAELVKKPTWTYTQGACFIAGVFVQGGVLFVPTEGGKLLKDIEQDATATEIQHARMVNRKYEKAIEEGAVPAGDDVSPAAFLKWALDEEIMIAWTPMLPELLRHVGLSYRGMEGFIGVDMELTGLRFGLSQ